MIELAITEFERVLPLLSGIRQKVLPHAICGGFNPGRVFVDQRENPQVALIWSSVGYFFLAGDSKLAGNLTDIRQTLTETFVPASRALGETGFILVPSDHHWKDHLDELLPGRGAIEIYRRPFVFDHIQHAIQNDSVEGIPQGFLLKPVDGTLAEEIGILASWVSVELFLQNGLGFALMDGDVIASVCYSVFASSTHLEIDVHTDERYRRRGLAVLTAGAFIEECLVRSLQPNWECFWENEPSIALAGKLGFKAESDYPVWYWEE